MSESQPTTHTTDENQTELEKLIRSSGPWLSENATTLIYAAAAFLAIAAAIVYFNRKPSGNLEASRSLLTAVSPEDYRDVADEFPNTKIGIWSRLRQADRLRDNAVTHLFTDRVVGSEELDQSEAAYQQLADRTDLDEQVCERVLIGLARIADARLDGTQESADTAIAAYQRVLDEFDTSIDRKQCETRIAEIGSDASRSWNAWFHAYSPTPATSVPGLPGMSSGSQTPAATSDSATSTSPDIEGEKPESKVESTPEKTKEAAPADEKADTKPKVEKADAEEKPSEKSEAPAKEKAAVEDKAEQADTVAEDAGK